MLARNTVVSTLTFLFDLLLLWALVRWFGMDMLVAAALGFVVATSIHYLFGRIWIFRGTERGVASGYLYFLLNAGIGLVVTMAAFAALTSLPGLHFLVARVIASVAAGLTVFVLNAVLNFRSL